jgi:predicted transcriptional regulator
MAATSLKLPDDLKQRLERFAAEAAKSERQALSGGKTYALDETFDYLEKRVAGDKVRRPKARAWRASK